MKIIEFYRIHSSIVNSDSLVEYFIVTRILSDGAHNSVIHSSCYSLSCLKNRLILTVQIEAEFDRLSVLLTIGTNHRTHQHHFTGLLNLISLDVLVEHHVHDIEFRSFYVRIVEVSVRL